VVLDLGLREEMIKAASEMNLIGVKMIVLELVVMETEKDDHMLIVEVLVLIEE
jgi:hypothetical protein